MMLPYVAFICLDAALYIRAPRLSDRQVAQLCIGHSTYAVPCIAAYVVWL